MLMRVRSLVLRTLAAAVVLSGPALGYAVAAHRTAHAAPKAHHVYRLDYLMTVHEPDKADVTDAYEMSVEDGGSGDLRAWTNIPLAIGSPKGQAASPRQDVGLRLDGQVKRVGEALLLHSTMELSAPGVDVGEGATPIRKITAIDDALLAMGKPALVARVEEPVSHARYEVTVTAVEVR
jgi:hypothetical protein